MLKFKTIAVATDLSEAGSVALRYGLEIARRHQATVVIVHVTDPVSYAFPTGTPKILTADRSARDEVSRIEAETRRHGIAVHSVVESGIVCERLLQAVEDHHVDLLVLGTRAKTEAGRVALGTVARYLLAKAPCAILTVSPEAQVGSAGAWRRVLVATDFSAASLAGLHMAQAIVHDKLLVVHAIPREKEYQSLGILEQLRLLAPMNESHTVPVEHVVAPVEPGELIANYAHEFHPDLVVLGSPSVELTAQDYVSSTVLQVVSQVACPVLCVPPARRQVSRPIETEVAIA